MNEDENMIFKKRDEKAKVLELLATAHSLISQAEYKASIKGMSSYEHNDKIHFKEWKQAKKQIHKAALETAWANHIIEHLGERDRTRS